MVKFLYIPVYNQSAISRYGCVWKKIIAIFSRESIVINQQIFGNTHFQKNLNRLLSVPRDVGVWWLVRWCIQMYEKWGFT